MNLEPVNSKSKPKISRRDFLRFLKVVGLESVLLAIGGSQYLREYEPSRMEVNQVRLQLPRLARPFSGLRLVQISDLHFGGWMTAGRMRDAAQAVLDQSPDLVVITGDFVMGHHYVPDILEKLGQLAEALQLFSGRFPTFGVLGNHDYWLGRSSVMDTLRLAGIQVLNNAVHTLELGGAKLHIAGVDDVLLRQAQVERVVSQLPNEGCAVLLAHEPDFADTSAATGRFDLQLSGHSHGGQVVLPWIGPPVLPYLGQKYPSGLYKVGDMLQYTNRGLGMSPPYIRFNCRPEITVFTLESI